MKPNKPGWLPAMARWPSRGHGILDTGVYAALAIVASTIGVLSWVLATITGEVARRLAVDYTLYMDATRSWLAGGSFYQPWQLTGPYEVVAPASMYPPTTLALLVPASFLPAALWWLVPIVLAAWGLWGAKPPRWSWPILALLATYPNTGWLIVSGNPVMYAVAGIAISRRIPGASILALVKPTLAPFVLLGAGRRVWVVGAVIFGLAAVLTLSMWPDYFMVIANARGPRASFLYAVYDLPIVLAPLLVVVTSPRRSRSIGTPPSESA